MINMSFVDHIVRTKLFSSEYHFWTGDITRVDLKTLVAPYNEMKMDSNIFKVRVKKTRSMSTGTCYSASIMKLKL